MAAALKLGPWGGKGGLVFDDGCCNGEVKKLIIYYSDTVLKGFCVAYADGTTKQHGAATGPRHYEMILTWEAPLENVCVYVGNDPAFKGDPARVGVVSLGVSAWAPPDGPFPRVDPAKVTQYRPQILGFFGRATASGVDSLGFYLSNPARE